MSVITRMGSTRSPALSVTSNDTKRRPIVHSSCERRGGQVKVVCPAARDEGPGGAARSTCGGAGDTKNRHPFDRCVASQLPLQTGSIGNVIELREPLAVSVTEREPVVPAGVRARVAVNPHAMVPAATPVLAPGRRQTRPGMRGARYLCQSTPVSHEHTRSVAGGRTLHARLDT